MGLNAFLGRSRHLILPFFALVTSLVTPSISLAKINIEECERVLKLAQEDAAIIMPEYLRMVRQGDRQILRGSLSAQAGIKHIGKDTFLLPRGNAINDNYGLVEGQSPIFFIEVQGIAEDRFPLGGYSSLTVQIANGDIHPDIYHFLLAYGYLPITKPLNVHDEESFSHDVLDHVPGFKKISQLSIWPVIKRMLLEVIYAESKTERTSEIFKEAVAVRFEIGTMLEHYSTQLTRDDQGRGKGRDTVADLLTDFQKILLRWNNAKTQNQFVIPDVPFSNEERIKKWKMLLHRPVI